MNYIFKNQRTHQVAMNLEDLVKHTETGDIIEIRDGKETCLLTIAERVDYYHIELYDKMYYKAY